MNIGFASIFARTINRSNIQRQIAKFSIDQIGSDNAENPFNYMEKRYRSWHVITHSILGNMGDNTLSISVDGNLGSGATTLARQLASKIKFLFIPLPDVDKMHYNKELYNIKTRYNDCVLPDRTLLSKNEWLHDCNANTTIRYYHYEALTRIHQYRMGLMHLMSTGQGVLFNSSYWSDPAFAKALHRHKLISDIAYESYQELRQIYDFELKRPHLVIYIDKPVRDCFSTLAELQEQSILPKSLLFNDMQFLETLREEQLRLVNEIEKFSHVLVYNSDELKDNVDMIVEDMETIDFTTKCEDWKITYTGQLNEYLHELSSESRWSNMKISRRKYQQVPELTILGEEAKKASFLLNNHPETRKKNGLDLGWKEQIRYYYNLLLNRERPMPFH
ncbi:hypothetical protein GJ496_005156 [Pomphorhynchus laevis]|nr:hypothetical protein GJ496_005156 [Pomphorhynchus laevis]